MKKVLLLCALVGASQLYSMEKVWTEEQEKQARKDALAIYTSSEMLPELKQEILNRVLATSNTFEEAINAIKVAAVLQRFQFNTLPLFNALMDKLAKKFPDKSRMDIAKKFEFEEDIAIAGQYLELNERFYKMVSNSQSDSFTLNECKGFIDEGADVSYTRSGLLLTGERDRQFYGILMSVCYFAIYNPAEEGLEILQYLLQQGSDPNIYVGAISGRETLLQDLKKHYVKPKYGDSVNIKDKVIQMLEQYGAKLVM